MIRERILEAFELHTEGIMQFTLGNVVDEYDEKYCDVYKYEWVNHRHVMVKSIETIMQSNIPLKPDMIVGIIVNEWFSCVGCDVEDLNYYGLLGVAIEIINYIEDKQSEVDYE